MNDLFFDLDEFKSAIKDLVPDYQKNTVFSALDIEIEKISELDAVGLTLTGEQPHSGFIFLTSSGTGKNQQSIWVAIKNELYDFFCTASKKYLKERTEGAISVKNIVVIVATAIAANFHVAAGVFMGAVTVALMGILKIGKNAWCEVNNSDKKLIT